MEMTPSKPDAVLDGQETPKMSSNTPVMEEQVLSWLIELLTLQGAVGLFTDWLPEHFLSMFTIDVDAFGAFTDFRADGPDLQTCLELGNRAYSRELWLVQVTAQNRSLYPRVLALVESRLLARGIPRERLGGLTHRQKLIMYAEMDLPRAPPQASFTLYLVMAKDAQGSTRESAKLFFPYTTTFARFQGILRDFTAYSAIQTGRTGGYTLRDGPWIYQLVGPNKAIIPGLPKYSIADEADFRMMKKQLQNKDSPSACIFHVSLSPFPSE